jgi:hypothetical protein
MPPIGGGARLHAAHQPTNAVIDGGAAKTPPWRSDSAHHTPLTSCGHA